MLPDPEIVGRQYQKRSLVWAVQINKPFVVETLEGTMHGKPGDYLCKGIDGELWPCAQSIFERSYSEVISVATNPTCNHFPRRND